MKKLIALGILSLSATAFSQTCYVDMVHTPTNRVVRSFVAYGDPNTCVEGMKECRKSIRLDYSANPSYPNGTLDCVRAGEIPGPIPTPGPGPRPTPGPGPRPTPGPGPRPTPGPGPQYGVTVEGRIEGINVSFQAATVGQIYNQCSDWVRGSLSQADDIMISFNGNAYIMQYNSAGWWRGTQICDVIYNLATPQNLAPERFQFIQVEGYVENIRVAYSGNTFGQVFNACVRDLEGKISQADDMEIGVNGDRRFRTVNSSSWWRGAHQICSVVTKDLPR